MTCTCDGLQCNCGGHWDNYADPVAARKEYFANQEKERAMADNNKTSTGRISESKPNIQSNATKTEEARRIIEAFRPVIIHITPKLDETCRHDWPEGSRGTDMDGSCTKCGMSFQRYIHTECP